MHDDEFHHLALKTLAGEASPEESVALERCLQAEPQRRTELEELRAALAITRTTLPLAAALETKATAEVPPHRVNQLRSAVRLHFQKQESEEKSKMRSASPLVEFFVSWKRVLAGGLVALALVILFSSPRPQGIEIGFYAEGITRNGAAALSFPTASSTHITRFESDQAFDQWLARPFAPDEKARIWFDEERDLIHIRLRAKWWQREATEFTRHLPAADADRRVAVESLLCELR